MIKLPKITSTMNPVQMYKKLNDLVDVARSPLKRSTAYELGEMVHPYNLANYLALECVQAGTTSAFDLVLTNKKKNDRLTDGTVIWKVIDLRGGDGITVGFERFTTNPNVEAGWKPEFGQLVTRAECDELWAWVLTQDGYLISEAEWQIKYAANDGNVPYYSAGDGTTTFRLPSMKCWVKGANGIEELSDEDKRYLSAGLPNITGTIRAESLTRGMWYEASGVFADSPSNNNGYGSASIAQQNGNSSLVFNANKGNSIYGNSDTVQPKSIVGMWQVKAYGSVNTMGEASVDGIASGLATLEATVENKANRDLDNLTDNGKKAFFPSGTFINITSNTYVAPANGFVDVISKVNAGGYLSISCDNLGHQIFGYANGNNLNSCLPITKGATVSISTNGTLVSRRFIYAESEV